MLWNKERSQLHVQETLGCPGAAAEARVALPPIKRCLRGRLWRRAGPACGAVPSGAQRGAAREVGERAGDPRGPTIAGFQGHSAPGDRPHRSPPAPAGRLAAGARAWALAPALAPLAPLRPCAPLCALPSRSLSPLAAAAAASSFKSKGIGLRSRSRGPGGRAGGRADGLTSVPDGPRFPPRAPRQSPPRSPAPRAGRGRALPKGVDP